jgi:hypothetical protein
MDRMKPITDVVRGFYVRRVISGIGHIRYSNGLD